MTRYLVLAFSTLALLLGAAPTQAQAVRAIVSSDQHKAVVSGDPNRRVCKERKPTGTRLSKGKICRTAKEWADATADSHDGIRALQRTGGHDGQIHGSSRQPGNLQLGRPQ